jgi:hypothetical protein
MNSLFIFNTRTIFFAKIFRYHNRKTVSGDHLVRPDLSIKTREISFSNLRSDKESIASVLEELVDTFSFDSQINKKSNALLQSIQEHQT